MINYHKQFYYQVERTVVVSKKMKKRRCCCGGERTQKNTANKYEILNKTKLATTNQHIHNSFVKKSLKKILLYYFIFPFSISIKS